jgi:SAM-dependent methyltransferase
MSYSNQKIEKTGFYYKNVRSEIVSLLPENIKRTLEIGCGEGNTLVFLKQSRGCLWAAGVEVSPQAADIARGKVDLMLEGNFEAMELPINKGSLDLILCLDVLEHLIDPWTAVRRLHQLLVRGGVMIASIPNVRSFRVLAPLLFRGEWQYAQGGILDKTHLRFFTRQSAIELLESSGLNVDLVDATGLEKGRKTTIANALTFSIFKPFFEHQYLIRARRVD